MRYVGLNDPVIDTLANLCQYEFTDREPPVSNEVYVYDDDCTAVAPLRGVAPSATRVPETVCTESRVEETVDGGEFVAGLFD